jgi:hypothetical protein
MGVAGHPHGGQGGWLNHPSIFFLINFLILLLFLYSAMCQSQHPRRAVNIWTKNETGVTNISQISLSLLL